MNLQCDHEDEIPYLVTNTKCNDLEVGANQTRKRENPCKGQMASIQYTSVKVIFEAARLCTADFTFNFALTLLVAHSATQYISLSVCLSVCSSVKLFQINVYQNLKAFPAYNCLSMRNDLPVTGLVPSFQDFRLTFQENSVRVVFGCKICSSGKIVSKILADFTATAICNKDAWQRRVPMKTSSPCVVTRPKP